MSDDNDNGTGTEETSELHLKRAKMLPVEGVVYCLVHNAVHDDTTDPYGTGDEECAEKEHRPVYYRGRKGDIDESRSFEAEMFGEPQHGEVIGSIGLPDGAVVIDRLTDVQDRIKKRVIASRSDALTDNEAQLLARMVQSHFLKLQRNKDDALLLLGDDYDPAMHDERLALLEGIHRKLGDVVEGDDD